MSLALGIHNGHHASCAIVSDGTLVAAVQQERFSRVKGDGRECLSNTLPLEACLKAASADLKDIDVIVSSFQAASPGGIGLHRPLVEPGFNLFDPFDARHFVVSHHLGHALASFGSSGFQDAAVLVCDLGGSSSADGHDFFLPFARFKSDICSLPDSNRGIRTECMSIYELDGTSIQLHKRRFCVPHNVPEVFVSSAASLYDNASRAIFGRENAHGQLMALASLENREVNNVITPDRILNVTNDGEVVYRNDWQQLVEIDENELLSVGLASAVQTALQRAVMEYVTEVRQLTRSQNLTCSGGIFLNILANSEILNSGLFHKFYVPSSPHDTGIAVGCAYAGARMLGGEVAKLRAEAIDRLGPRYSVQDIDRALSSAHINMEELKNASAEKIAELIRDGMIVARFSGRAEFGPRALGGRSLLASPLLMESKIRLNRIKGRQFWRPVAPIVKEDRLEYFFEGPSHSPYMNFVHRIPLHFREALPALLHPDGSTRAQTLRQIDDPFLHDILTYFEKFTGFPVLVNTSLNGPGEPMVESPDDAISFFLANEDVDCLLLEDKLLQERIQPHWMETQLAPDVLITFVSLNAESRAVMIRGRVSLDVSRAAFDFIQRLGFKCDVAEPSATVKSEIERAVRLRFLVRTSA